MSPSPAAEPSRLSRLLRDLGPRIQRGSRAATHDARAPLATGVDAFDRLLGGGLAPGRVGEWSGPAGSGRTSLAFALLARATAAGECVAWVDPADAFHPASAAAAGVRLERVLWVRPPGAGAAARCCERLLATRGFAAVALDAAGPDAARAWSALPTATWQRLARAAAASGSALLVLSQRRITASAADLALELRPAAARFGGTPSLFEGLEIEAVVARRRRAGGPEAARLRIAAG